MRLVTRYLAALLLSLGLLLPVSVPASADSPKSEDEAALDVSDANALQIRRKLFTARQKGDKDKIKKLEKQFKKAQDERVRLLRKTWQM